MENFEHKVILIHQADNVLVTVKTLQAGEKLRIGENEIIVNKTIPLGHKMAGKEIRCGDKVIKYGVPIGSATMDIPIGSHVHIHNMKSDYLPTYTLDKKNNHDK